MQTSAEILNIIKQRNLNVQEVATQSEIPSARIYKWLDGKGNPKVEDSDKLLKWGAKYLDKVPREKEKGMAPAVPEQEKQPVDINERSIYNLSESNKKATDANLILARLLEKTMNKVTANDDQQTFRETVGLVLGLRELVSDLAVQVQKKSLAQIRDELDKRVKANLQKIGHTDSVTAGGK